MFTCCAPMERRKRSGSVSINIRLLRSPEKLNAQKSLADSRSLNEGPGRSLDREKGERRIDLTLFLVAVAALSSGCRFAR
jgi:hypothetical protein